MLALIFLKLKMKRMSRISEYYSTRGYDDQTDYEKLAWIREQEINEQWELEEQSNNLKDNHGKFLNENRVYNGSGKVNTDADRT